MDVPPRLWDVKNSRASGKSVEAQKINLAVDKIRVEVNRRYQELMQTDGYVTAAKLKDAYLGIGVKQETLLKLFEQHNAEFEKKVGHSRAQGRFTRYRTVCNHIREFLRHTHKREDIPLNNARQGKAVGIHRGNSTRRNTDGTRFVLTIDRKPIAEWFKEQFEKLRQNIRQPIQQRKGKGMKL